ncbi:MAG: gamma-glutamyl-gamma-aminobutyrate hydrolase family protein [Acidobacteria bacterium]|nr:gamma-glutamyl-gamma-aminobutyrate hydrolase family protein [Acidobacteriota bacterium]
MIQELKEQTPLNQPEPLPFPFNQRTFCRYERIEMRIESARVLVVNDLLHEESDLSEVAHREWGAQVATHIAQERHISSLAVENILSNIRRLVRRPETEVAHLAEVAEAVERFRPEAIVLSGTLSDFDYYNPAMIESFGHFIRATKIPVLGICGGHQLIGLCFGARIVTLDNREAHEMRVNRSFEYQYRFIRITDPGDPIFHGIHDQESGIWQDYTTEGNILRVWQNHGLQLDRVPEGFKSLATAYLCKNQMMVKRAGGQLIYAVQFHLEKSFQDLTQHNPVRDDPNSRRMLREEASKRTRWAHQNESRDGRILFENFLREALKHSARGD